MRTFIITTNRIGDRFDTLSRKLSSIGTTLPVINYGSFEVYSWKIQEDIVYVPFIVNIGQLDYYERRTKLAECIKKLNIPNSSLLFVLLHISDYYGRGDESLVVANEFVGLTQSVVTYRFHHGEPDCIADLWMEEDVTDNFCNLITQHIFENE